MTGAIVTLLGLWYIAAVSAAPVSTSAWFRSTVSELKDRVDFPTDLLCGSKRCLIGNPSFDLWSLSCVCPDWPPAVFCNQLRCATHEEPFYSVIGGGCYCRTLEEWYQLRAAVESRELRTDERQHGNRDEETGIAGPFDPRGPIIARSADAPVPSFIPPPKQGVTPALLNESLTVQPQNAATVGSVIPYFHDNVIKFLLQLNGFVAETLAVNASASLPCGAMGTEPEPNIALVPKFVLPGQGQPQVVVADCQCIAVNMYSSTVVTYWFQKMSDGSIYSLVGSNKVTDIDKIDTSQSVALSLVTTPVGPAKRHHDKAPGVQPVAPVRRQIFRTLCNKPCPFYHMRKLAGDDGYCGCVFSGSDEEVRIAARALSEPDVHTATMTAAACAAMTCYLNGHAPAVFNPFSRTCWCAVPPSIESNPNAWSGSS